MWHRPNAEKSWRYYLGPDAGEVSPYASPAIATDLTGLPPAYVTTMEFDPLRDEGIIYALRMMEAGVSVVTVSLGDQAWDTHAMLRLPIGTVAESLARPRRWFRPPATGPRTIKDPRRFCIRRLSAARCAVSIPSCSYADAGLCAG